MWPPFPTFCQDCSEVIVINEYDKNSLCAKCQGNKIILYSNSCLYKTDEKKIKIKELIENNDPDRINEEEEEIGITELDLYEIINENGDDEEKKNDDLGSLNVEGLLNKENMNDDYEYADDLAAEGYYLCPKCNQFLMEKFHLGLWDWYKVLLNSFMFHRNI